MSTEGDRSAGCEYGHPGPECGAATYGVLEALMPESEWWLSIEYCSDHVGDLVGELTRLGAQVRF